MRNFNLTSPFFSLVLLVASCASTKDNSSFETARDGSSALKRDSGEKGGKESRSCESMVRSRQDSGQIMGIGYGKTKREADEAAMDEVARKTNIAVLSISRNTLSRGKRSNEIGSERYPADLLLLASHVVERCRGESGERASVAVVEKRELGFFFERRATGTLRPYLSENPGDLSEKGDEALEVSDASEHRLLRRWQRERGQIGEDLALCRYFNGCSEEYQNDLAVIDNWMRVVASRNFRIEMPRDIVPGCLLPAIISKGRELGYQFSQSAPSPQAGTATVSCRSEERIGDGKSREKKIELDCVVRVVHKTGEDLLRFSGAGSGKDAELSLRDACAKLRFSGDAQG